MLTLKRRRGERLVLVMPDGVTVAWVLVDRNCRLSVQAPCGVRVFREEQLTQRQRAAYGADRPMTTDGGLNEAPPAPEGGGAA